MRPIYYYLLGTGGWFAGFGIQGVLFAWLVAMELRASPEALGVAQMSLLLPGTLLMLIGGSFADRFGARRVLVIAQCIAAFNPILLTILLLLDRLTYPSMIFYAVLMIYEDYKCTINLEFVAERIILSYLQILSLVCALKKYLRKI